MVVHACCIGSNDVVISVVGVSVLVIDAYGITNVVVAGVDRIVVVVVVVYVAAAGFRVFVGFFLRSILVVRIPSHMLFSQFFTPYNERSSFSIREKFPLSPYKIIKVK